MESATSTGAGGEPQSRHGAAYGSRDRSGPSMRAILRIILTVVLSALALYLLYLLRTPIGWLVIATFIAISVAGPINRLSLRMPRGAAIALVYLLLTLVPAGIGAILIPPAVEATANLVNEFPVYVDDINETIAENETLQGLNEDFDLTGKLNEFANNAAGSIDDAAGVVADIGAGLLGSLFAGFTIIVMSMFMVSRGREWTDRALALRPRHEAEALRRALDRIAEAVAGFVGGALLQAVIAGIAAFTMLSILGVPSPLALAVIVAILDLFPLVGATVGAVLVGIVTLFTGFPVVTIIWAVFAIAYQQFENYVVQPRIQSRAVALDPFLIVVAAIFGGTLLGILGALLAIPTAAAIQIAAREFIAFRRTYHGPEGSGSGSGSEPPAAPAATPG
jgi:predicted PurR-regulated permease PerM